MPGGIFSVSLALLRARPAPRRSLHGFSTTCPSPPHCGQGCDIEKKPCENCTRPEPRHCEHFLTPEPDLAPEPPHVSQLSMRSNCSGFCSPAYASSRLTSISYL